MDSVDLQNLYTFLFGLFWVLLVIGYPFHYFLSERKKGQQRGDVNYPLLILKMIIVFAICFSLTNVLYSFLENAGIPSETYLKRFFEYVDKGKATTSAPDWSWEDLTDGWGGS